MKTKQIDNYDIFIVDQLSICVPLLHIWARGKILFYCHFPDLLLANRNNIIKKLYRIPFDLLEQFTISSADRIIVNSKFNRSIFQDTFKLLTIEPKVIYPCVDL